MDPGFAIYVVHSAPLVDRRTALTAALTRCGWRAEWIVEPDTNLGTLVRLRHRAHPRVSASELSVYLKHLEALTRIARGTDERALVLEDDALLPDGLPETLSRYLAALPAGVDMAYFGVSCDLHAEPFDNSGLFGPGLRTRSMSAVVITRACAAALVARLDGAAVRHPIDITIDDLIRNVPLSCVWSVPPLVGNGSESGAFARAIAPVRWRQHRMVRALRRGLRHVAG